LCYLAGQRKFSLNVKLRLLAVTNKEELILAREIVEVHWCAKKQTHLLLYSKESLVLESGALTPAFLAFTLELVNMWTGLKVKLLLT